MDSSGAASSAVSTVSSSMAPSSVSRVSSGAAASAPVPAVSPATAIFMPASDFSSAAAIFSSGIASQLLPERFPLRPRNKAAGMTTAAHTAAAARAEYLFNIFITGLIPLLTGDCTLYSSIFWVYFSSCMSFFAGADFSFSPASILSHKSGTSF